MNNKKRNITVLAVLVFVCAAVFLNWSFNNRWGKADSEMAAVEDEKMAEASTLETDFEAVETVETGYFAEATLTRQLSRDEALELLQTAASADGAARRPSAARRGIPTESSQSSPRSR